MNASVYATSHSLIITRKLSQTRRVNPVQKERDDDLFGVWGKNKSWHSLYKRIMLKAIQILGCSSSGFVSHRWKPHNNARTRFSFVRQRLPTTSSSSSSSILRVSSTRRNLCFTAFRAHSDSNPRDPSPSSVSVKSGVNFCQWCGGPTKHDVPEGEEKIRAICTVCGKITYQNPKMVVGCLIEQDNKVLPCKRKIQPSYGLWTLPAGYMEIGESAAEGAMRETWEEACAEVDMLSPFAQLDIPLIGQTYIIFLAKLKKPQFAPGPESSECRLFALDNIPFNSLAFSSMLVTLNLYVQDVKAGKLKFHYGTINKRPGTSPSDIHAFTLDYRLQS